MAHVRRLRVMLVEDNDFTRSTVASSLREEDCDVVAAVATARDAMLAAESNDLDCAVIDLHLGQGPSGIDVAHGLREQDPDLGIVLLTSFADPRLLSGDQRPLPPGTVYVVKDDLRTTAQLRESLDKACGERLAGKPTVGGRVPLTDLQVELLRMVADGLTNSEIAKRRVVSERSVETALARIMRRLEIDPAQGENPRVLMTQAYYQLIGGAGTR